MYLKTQDLYTQTKLVLSLCSYQLTVGSWRKANKLFRFCSEHRPLTLPKTRGPSLCFPIDLCLCPFVSQFLFHFLPVSPFQSLITRLCVFLDPTGMVTKEVRDLTILHSDLVRYNAATDSDNHTQPWNMLVWGPLQSAHTTSYQAASTVGKVGQLQKAT